MRSMSGVTSRMAISTEVGSNRSGWLSLLVGTTTGGKPFSSRSRYYGGRMVELECQRCGRVWDYGGSRHYATCPNCKTSVKAGPLPSEESDEEAMVDIPMEEDEQTVPEAVESLGHMIDALWDEFGDLEERVADLEDEEAPEVDERGEQVKELYKALNSVIDQVGGSAEFDHSPVYDPTEEFEDE